MRGVSCTLVYTVLVLRLETTTDIMLFVSVVCQASDAKLEFTAHSIMGPWN